MSAYEPKHDSVNLRNFLRNCLEIFGKFLKFFVNFFGGIFLKFFGNFSEEFLEEFFWRNFFGGIFLEEFFGRNFSGGFFWEEFFGRIIRRIFWEELELTCLSRFWFLSRFCLNGEGQEI
jgi:hypothetical protein